MICQNCLEQSSDCICGTIRKANKVSEIQTLRRRWSAADDGNPMPEDIARQPIDIIRKAVAWREKGIVVAVPKSVVPMEEVAESSLREWDGESNN